MNLRQLFDRFRSPYTVDPVAEQAAYELALTQRRLVVRLVPNGVEVEFAEMDRRVIGRASSEVWQEWGFIVLEFLIFAYRGRPACLIELAHSGKSVADWLRKHWFDVLVLKPKRSGVILSFVDRCSVGLLHDILDDWGFEVGWLWFSSISRERPDRALDLVRAVEESEAFSKVPITTEELLVQTHDSRSIMWLNGRILPHYIVNELERLAGRFGWTVDSSGIADG